MRCGALYGNIYGIEIIHNKATRLTRKEEENEHGRHYIRNKLKYILN